MVCTEFCQNEEFKASCSSSSVVVITSARYGRMSVGRCVRRDYGFVGCGSDVLGITDQLCSGRRNCSVRVPNSWYDDAAQRARCPEDFRNYLRVSYDCVEGWCSCCTAESAVIRLLCFATAAHNTGDTKHTHKTYTTNE